MSWTGDQIYTKPNLDLIQFLQTIDGFKHKLFHVTDLDGIRSKWVKNNIFSKTENEHSFKKHGLPENGLLVIKPNYYRSLYDKNDEDFDFWEKFENGQGEENDDKTWNFIDSLTKEEMSLDSITDLSPSQLKLLSFLQFLNEKFKVPFLYYYCFMWGGEIELEYFFVFENGLKIYSYDVENKKSFQFKDNQRIKLESTVLQTGFKHLKFNLPSWYFAPHGGLFDWKKYYIRTK